MRPKSQRLRGRLRNGREALLYLKAGGSCMQLSSVCDPAYRSRNQWAGGNGTTLSGAKDTHR